MLLLLLKEPFAAVAGQCRKAYGEWIKNGQTASLEEMTQNFFFLGSATEGMRRKGWTVEQDKEAGKPVMMATIHSIHVLPVIGYSAVKGPHEKGGLEWYKDLCDVAGYSRSAIPDEAVRRSPPTYTIEM